MTTRQQNVDALKGAIRDYVRALIASEQGQIAFIKAPRWRISVWVMPCVLRSD
jgi:hypothetical protein